jgi:hypothetical protein
MPIPKPGKGEKREEFISRCMGTPAMVDEYDQEQRAAICYTAWKDKGKKAASNEMTPLVANIDLTQVRTRRYKGRQHYVAPVVMAVPGVMNELLYPADELAKFTSSWDGRPVTLFHPKNADGEFISANSEETPEEVHLGLLRNTVFDESLKSETWLDIEHTRETRPEVLEYYEGQKDKLEVSTGLWGDVVRVAGKHDGVDYKGIMTNIRPDHLALLPGGEGACSWKAGCGLRANEEKEMPTWDDALAKFYAMTLANESLTDTELRSSVQRAVDALDNQEVFHYVQEIIPDKKQIIYQQMKRDGSGRDDKLWRCSYNIDSKGNVTLSVDREEVRRKVSYVTTNETEETIMKKEEIIKALIADPRTKFEEGCNDFLSGLNEQQLERLIPAENVIIKPAEEPKTEEPKTNEDAPKQLTASEWLEANQDLPKEVRDTLVEAVASNAMQRAELIEVIAKDPRNLFTSEQLTVKPLSELKAIVALAKTTEEPKKEEVPTFFGMRVSTNAPKKEDDKKGPEPLITPNLVDVLQERFKTSRSGK